MHFSSLGFVSILAEYLPLEIEGLFSPIKSLKNVKSVIRWIRNNSKDLGINPNKIIAAGASAGGDISCFLGFFNHFNLNSFECLFRTTVFIPLSLIV